MKDSFISRFIQALGEAGDIAAGIFIRESLWAKDLRLAGYDPDKIIKGFRNLEYRGILKTHSSGEYRFTTRGKQWLRHHAYKDIRQVHGPWDGTWRIVIFDIPQELHTQRVKLRKKLKTFGFFMLQKSIFVFPYPCEEELAYICKELGVTNYVDVLIGATVGFHEDEIKKYFRL